MDDNLNKKKSEKKDENLSADEILAKLDDSLDSIPEAPVQDWDGLVDVSEHEAKKVLKEETVEEAEVDEETHEEISEEIGEYELCVRCSKRKRFTDIDKNYEFCKHCREEMKKMPMNWKGVVTFLFMGVAVVVAIIYWFFSAMLAVPVVRGDYYTSKGKLLSAYNCYTAANNSAKEINSVVETQEFQFDAGLKTTKKIIFNSYQFGLVQGVTEAVSQYFPDEELNKPKNSKLKKVYEKSKRIQDTVSAINEDFNAFAAIEDKTDKVLEEYLKKMDEIKKDKNVDPAIVEYYKYVLCIYVKGNEEKQLQYLGEIEKNHPDYIWLYGTPMVETNLILGNSKKAFDYANKMEEFNKESIDAYAMRAKIYIRQEQYDKALDVCKKGTNIYNDIINNTDETIIASLLTQQSIASALGGDIKTAATVISEAYEIGVKYNYQSLTLEQANLYALFNKLAGNNEEYNEAKEMLEGSGLKIADKVTECIDKKITLVDIFVKGDIQWY